MSSEIGETMARIVQVTYTGLPRDALLVYT
jgi:hypothetical protein